MIVPNFEVQTMKQMWRLVCGAVLGILIVAAISNHPGADSRELWKRAEVFLLLALWALTSGATLGMLIYYDLHRSLRRPRKNRTAGETLNSQVRSDSNV
jgi:hypothetical protein